MDSSLIGKIEKAKRYAEERERVSFSRFDVRFRGENGDHSVRFENGGWSCNCHYFSGHRVCSHTMALQRILDGMLPSGASAPVAATG